MPPYTIDASVFLNGFNPLETGYADSKAFLDFIKSGAAPVVVPALLLPELAGAIGRGQNDPGRARKFAHSVSKLPQLMILPVDLPLAQQASSLAAQYRLRGSDAIYVAVAYRFGCVLITLDLEQLQRVKTIVITRTPADENSQLGFTSSKGR